MHKFKTKHILMTITKFEILNFVIENYLYFAFCHLEFHPLSIFFPPN